MNKINWTEEDLKKVAKPYVICENCGWLVSDYKPKKGDKCSNCGTKYNDADSEATGGEV